MNFNGLPHVQFPGGNFERDISTILATNLSNSDDLSSSFCRSPESSSRFSPKFEDLFSGSWVSHIIPLHGILKFREVVQRSTPLCGIEVGVSDFGGRCYIKRTTRLCNGSGDDLKSYGCEKGV